MRSRDPCARRLSMCSALAGALLLGFGLFVGAAAPLAAQEGERWVAPARRAARTNPVESNDQTIQQGRELYVRECAPCHGANGNNDGPKAPKELKGKRKPSDPSLREESDGALFWKIAEGRGAMPSTNEFLNDRERWLIVIYLRTLAPK